MRFYGHGVHDIDRVKIPIDPQVPADVGATDWTLEWWMKATLEENGSPDCTPGWDNWIYGNILFDRDIWGPGDYGDYGVSLAGGRIAFGANNGSSGETLCGSTLVADGNWHHVAVTRRLSDGLLSIFVDGELDAQVDGPDGDLSYRDGRDTSYEDDPFLVIGAEKHDAGPSFPSYSGWVDEVRLSTVIRYTAAFVPPAGPFSSDGDTAALYHLDEGPVGACAGVVLDASLASGGPSPGRCNYGGTAPAGPVYSSDTPSTTVNKIYLPLVLKNSSLSGGDEHSSLGLVLGLASAAALLSLTVVFLWRAPAIRGNRRSYDRGGQGVPVPEDSPTSTQEPA
jgi:hypothetical protein